MNKKINLLLALSLVTIAIFYFWAKPPEAEQWQTYNKVDHGKIESYPTTEKEVQKYKLPVQKKEKKKQRSPASVSPTQKKGRDIINPMGIKLKKSIEFHNKIDKQWKEKLGQNLLRFLRPDTKVFVKKQSSVSLLESGKLRHAEIVIIQLKSPEGRRFSYNAYIDSQSGVVLQTWNRTIHEFYGQKAKRISPSGIINSEGSHQF